MSVTNGNWQLGEDSVALSMSISKIDEENRLVSGWATLDNIDKQKDVVLASASRAAFSRFRGNIREMHDTKAVGRLVNFHDDEYYDPKTEKFYNGIFVTAYVSKGAQDTWEKVLDGTLNAFSIKGPIKAFDRSIMRDDNGKVVPVRIVKEYDMNELSLVDNPGNDLANVVSIMKSDEGVMLMKGMVADTRMETVFWCDTDGLAKTSTDESESCGMCDSEMANIGWFEYDETVEKADAAKSVVEEYLAKLDSHENEGTIIQKSEEENEVADNTENEATEETLEKAAVVVEEETQAVNEVDEGAEEETATEEAEVEKAAEVSEVADEDEASELRKVLDDMKSAVLAASKEQSEAVMVKFDEVTESFTNRLSDLAGKNEEIADKLGVLSKSLDSFEERLSGVEDAFAIKKSGDLGGSSEDLTKSNTGGKWNGAFLSTAQL